MKLFKISVLSFVVLSAVLVGGLTGIGAVETAEDETLPQPQAEESVPVEEPAPSAEETGLPADDLFAPPAAEASCQSQACGNTGNLYGYGSNCTNAKNDVSSEMTAAAYEICPGIVTGITRNFGSCTSGSPIAECKYSGNADISCKICPGMSCEPDW